MRYRCPDIVQLSMYNMAPTCKMATQGPDDQWLAPHALKCEKHWSAERTLQKKKGLTACAVIETQWQTYLVGLRV